jgi:hypothetical protein
LTVPFIPACSVQLYGYAPAFGKVRETLVPLLFPMFPPVGAAPVNVTLCSGVATNVQVTEPPVLIVTDDGSNVLAAVAVTFADAGGGGPPPVTVTSTWAD